jgi:UDP-N-acetylmuramate: L-alanyl-gamma-D-glutamyl-meso-diaminopimelate ligase
VYFNPEKLAAKKLDSLSENDIKNAFANPSLTVFDDAKKLEDHLQKQSWKNRNLLMMSSGNFGGIDIKALSDILLA